MRHAAWLNAVPEVKQQQGKQSTQKRVAPKSRRESLTSIGIEPDMPPLEWGAYLVEYLFELGPTMAAGMGASPLMPSELHAAQQLLGIQFQPGEARLLLRLSRDYLAESHRATEHNCEPPWDDGIVRNIDAMVAAYRMEQEMLTQMED